MSARKFLANSSSETWILLFLLYSPFDRLRRPVWRPIRRMIGVCIWVLVRVLRNSSFECCFECETQYRHGIALKNSLKMWIKRSEDMVYLTVKEMKEKHIENIEGWEVNRDVSFTLTCFHGAFWKQKPLPRHSTGCGAERHKNGDSASESEVTGFHGEAGSVSKDGRVELRWALNYHLLNSEMRPFPISKTLGQFSQGQFSLY